MSQPFSLSPNNPLPYRIASSETVDPNDTNGILRGCLDNLAIISNRLAPQPSMKKLVVDLAAGAEVVFDLDTIPYNNILATVTGGAVNVYFGGNSNLQFDLQFVAGAPTQVYLAPMFNNQITFSNPDNANPAYAVIWIINY